MTWRSRYGRTLCPAFRWLRCGPGPMPATPISRMCRCTVSRVTVMCRYWRRSSVIAGSHRKIRRVDLVDGVCERHFCRRHRHRLVVQARPVEAQQLALDDQRQFRCGAVDQRHAFSPAKCRSQFFPNQRSCMVNRPISAYNSANCFSCSASAALATLASSALLSGGPWQDTRVAVYCTCHEAVVRRYRPAN